MSEKTKLIGGGDPASGEHRELKENGQQKDYVVLTEEERAKGFVRPVRLKYIHKTCGVETRMSESIAETYARNPKFYNATFCVSCKAHYVLSQFLWSDTDQEVGS